MKTFLTFFVTILFVAAANAAVTDELILPIQQQDVQEQNNKTLQDKRITACWKDTTTRGVGKAIHECARGLEQSGLLCYPPCKSGYAGAGPVCWESCKSGFTDAGAFCYKGKQIHVKKSYGRGVGKPLECSTTEVQDHLFFGICYPKCPSSSYEGVGPVCWNACPKKYSFSSGALCCETEEICKDTLKDLGMNLPIELARAVMDRKNVAKEIADAKAIIEDLLDLVLPLCSEA